RSRCPPENTGLPRDWTGSQIVKRYANPSNGGAKRPPKRCRSNATPSSRLGFLGGCFFATGFSLFAVCLDHARLDKGVELFVRDQQNGSGRGPAAMPRSFDVI